MEAFIWDSHVEASTWDSHMEASIRDPRKLDPLAKKKKRVLKRHVANTSWEDLGAHISVDEVWPELFGTQVLHIRLKVLVRTSRPTYVPIEFPCWHQTPGVSPRACCQDFARINSKTCWLANSVPLGTGHEGCKTPRLACRMSMGPHPPTLPRTPNNELVTKSEFGPDVTKGTPNVWG